MYIPNKEREKIRHEVNSLYYPKYNGLLYIAHQSVGLDNNYYIYLIKNLGFDNYIFLERYFNLDSEENSYEY